MSLTVILRPALSVLALLVLAGCATAPRPPPTPPTPPLSEPPAVPPVAETAQRVELASLQGWDREDHAAALAAWRATCGVARNGLDADACRRARKEPELAEAEARAYLERNFQAEPLPGDGVLTAYFAPEYEARRTPDEEFSAPVRPKPADLVIVDGGLFDPAQAGRPMSAVDTGAGALQPYPDRAAIEARPAADAIAWMRPEELFFLQIQGSGVLTFEDGTRRKAFYAANNGRPFTGVANVMRDRGLLAGSNTSGEAIRSWLAAHRGPQADAIMQLNPRYAFFTLGPDDGLEAKGAAGAPLPAGRAIAVDLTRHSLGSLYWLDAEAPILAGAFPAYRRLVVALDTGGAIQGLVRADLYMGTGAMAGAEAGRVRHRLRMYRLVPR